jgi:hypothetical protein
MHMNPRRLAVYRTDSRQRVLDVLKVAIRQRYADHLPKRQNERERVVATLANALLEQHQRCKHDGSTNEITRNLLNASASADECQNAQALIDELIVFTDYTPPDLQTELKLWTGRLWSRLRRYVRGEDDSWDPPTPTAVTGTRA